jgi:hypothetical protein
MIRLRIAATCALVSWLIGFCAPLGAQMPDPRQMSGLSMPSPELPDGTVSVRVVRGQITNNLQGVPVELSGAGDTRKGTTGADGRAMFAGVPAGSTVIAVAFVDGERIESQPIQVPARGGVRTLLAASEAPAATGAAPPPPVGTQAPATVPPATAARGELTIGSNSRIAAEFSEDALQIFYLFEIVNRSQRPVAPDVPLVFDMPADAESTSLLQGTTKQATVKGRQVTVTGPFRPGATPVEIAYRIDSVGPELTLEQRFPLPLDMVAVAVQKVGDLRVGSPQLSATQEAPIDRATFIMGNGPGLSAGTPLTLHLKGLPYRPRTGMYVALSLVAATLGLALWLATTRDGLSAAEARRRELEARRVQGLDALAALERARAADAIDPVRYESRRTSLMSRLERVYGELDGEGGPVAG